MCLVVGFAVRICILIMLLEYCLFLVLELMPRIVGCVLRGCGSVNIMMFMCKLDSCHSGLRRVMDDLVGEAVT